MMAVGVSAIGRRKRNEDCFVIARTRAVRDGRRIPVLTAAVCDGVGGMRSGERASAEVGGMLIAYLGEIARAIASEDERRVMPEVLKTFSRKAHLQLKQAEIEGGMGTTLTVMVIAGDTGWMLHIGDGRLFHLDERIDRLSEDQTWTAEAVRRGLITEREAARHPNRHMILQCLGAGEPPNPDIRCLSMRPGGYLICTDGFCGDGGSCPPLRIRPAMTRGELTVQLCSGLVSAERSGTGDNATAVLVQWP